MGSTKRKLDWQTQTPFHINRLCKGVQESSLIVEAQDIDPAGISSEENCQSERDNLSHIFQITYFNWRMDIGMKKKWITFIEWGMSE